MSVLRLEQAIWTALDIVEIVLRVQMNLSVRLPSIWETPLKRSRFYAGEQSLSLCGISEGNSPFEYIRERAEGFEIIGNLRHKKCFLYIGVPEHHTY